MAKFEKGKPRAEGAGRAKGTPNKRTLDLFAQCDALKINPFDELLKMAADKGLDEGLRLQALKEVAKYLYPARKSVELSADEEKGFVVVLKDFGSK